MDSEEIENLNLKTELAKLRANRRNERRRLKPWHCQNRGARARK